MKQKSKKVKSRRDSVKHPNLKPSQSPKARGKFIDYDYLDKLDDKTLDWLDKFTGEYHGASFNHDDTDIQDYKTYGKDCNDRNNAANRCHYNKKFVNYDSVAKSFEEQVSKDVNPMNLENAYVDFLESKQVAAMLEEYEKAMYNFNEADEEILK